MRKSSSFDKYAYDNVMIISPLNIFSNNNDDVKVYGNELNPFCVEENITCDSCVSWARFIGITSIDPQSFYCLSSFFFVIVVLKYFKQLIMQPA